MTKICFLANAASTHTQRWAKAMAQKGCQVDIVSFDKADIEGCTVHYIKPVKREMGRLPSEPKNLSYILKWKDVKNVVNSIKPDILHAHYATGYGLTGALSGFHPLIISTWGTDIFSAPRKNFVFKAMVEYNLQKADYITATSKALTAETGIYTKKQIYTIPFGIDVNKFCSLHRESSETITIGIVKSIEEVYGIEYLIKAFYKISTKYKNINLIIVGDGTLYSKMVELCRNYKIEDRVTFTGKVPNDDVPKYLNMMDIFVMPSLYESFGVAALEAQACEVPVIATSVGGILEVVLDKTTGFLVPPQDSDAIAEMMEVLIKDRGLRESMGLRGREFVLKHYDWSKNTEDMYNLYLKIIKNIK